MRQLVAVVAFAAAVCGIGVAAAQDYPSRPVHLIVGYPPGVAPDIVAR